MRKPAFTTIGILAAIVVLLDQWTKRWITTHFYLGETRPFGPHFSLTYVHNTGTAFGMFQGNNLVLLLLGFVILGVLLYSARELCERGGWLSVVGIGLVAGGAIGNLIDRMLIGRVIDFLDFHFWPVFNVADSAISVGAIGLALGIFRKEERT
jgi:signal peptidase II